MATLNFDQNVLGVHWLILGRYSLHMSEAQCFDGTDDTLMCLNTGMSETINFSFGLN